MIQIVNDVMTDEDQLRAAWGQFGVDMRASIEGDVALEESADPLWANVPREPSALPPNTNWGRWLELSGTGGGFVYARASPLLSAYAGRKGIGQN